MGAAAEARALQVALVLGAVQEARRRRSPVVATEHVLTASLADPIVRSAFAGIGVDLRAVQELADRETAARPRPAVTATLALTPTAAALVATVCATVPGLEEAPAPPVISLAYAAAMVALLEGEADSGARRVLGELDVLRRATEVIAAIRVGAAGDPGLPHVDRGLPYLW